MGYKYYYTLNEVIQDDAEILHEGRTSGFYHLCDLVYDLIPEWAKMTSDEYDYLDETLERVRSMFQREGTYFYVSDNELEGQDLTDEAYWRVMDFINTFYETKGKYIKLIQTQEALKDQILTSTLNTTNQTWFNDTPQNSGDYTDDTHNTNYTKSVSSQDVLGPVSVKLEEVDRAMDDIYTRWVNEFKKFRLFY